MDYGLALYGGEGGTIAFGVAVGDRGPPCAAVRAWPTADGALVAATGPRPATSGCSSTGGSSRRAPGRRAT